MSRISVAEIARVIAKKHKMTIRESEKFVTAFIDVINNGLRYEKQVKIKGLGTFKVIDTKNRKSVNIKTGEAIVIEGRGKITFTPDAVMRDLVNKPFSQFETVELNDGVNFEDIEQVFATGKEDDAIAYEALFAADGVQSEEPEPVLTTKPEIVDELEPVEETDEEPELIETPETEPIAGTEPEPEEEPKSESDDLPESELIEASETESIEVPEPEPEEEPKSESNDSPESKLIEASETESIAVPETEPEEEPNFESDDSPESELIEVSETESIAVPETEPEEEPKPESDESTESKLIEASGIESMAVPETEPEEEPKSEEVSEPTRETAEKETADEELLEVEPVGESRVNTHIFEDRKASLLQHYRDYSEELEYQLDRQKNYRKWFALISCLLIVAAGVGGYYAGSKIMKDKLDEQYQSMLVDNVSPDSISSMMEQEAKADSSAKAARLAKLREETDLRMKARQQSTQTNTAYETARERAKEITTIKSEQERAEKERFEADLKAKAQAREQKLKAEAEAKRQAQAKKLAEAEAAAQKAAAQKAAAQKAAAQKAAAPKTATAKPSSQSAKGQPNAGKVIPVSPSKYEQMSAAVRLGAYRIVGIDQTITVRKGQTLKSISKAYFGPGMECYVEALNGGIKEVSEGQKLKIPKLELKKKGNK